MKPETVMNDHLPIDSWEKSPIRVFISHVDQYKSDAVRIKSILSNYGIASFVAHEDIEPSEEWQSEIIRSLSEMNMFIALLTEGFHESNWADQEVGFALARSTPILPVNYGLIPYGFIGKIQALKWNGHNSSDVATKLFEMALENPSLREMAKHAYLAAVANALSFDQANRLALLLFKMDHFSESQEIDFVNAYNSNDQVFQAHSFRRYACGQLERLTGNTYVFGDDLKLHQLIKEEEIPF